MEEANKTAIEKLENKQIIEYLAETFPEEERKVIVRDMFIVTQIKTISAKEEYEDANGYMKTKNVKRKMTVYEALAYTMLCRDMGFNPALNLVTMLDGGFYIGLDAHRQYAQSTGICMGIDANMIREDEVEVEKVEWVKEGGKNQKKVVKVKSKQYEYRCIVKKKVGDEIVEYKGIGIADLSNVVGDPSDLKLRQMAEARSKRRALSDAFPPGVGHIEDVTEYPDYQLGSGEDKNILTENPDKFKRPEVISASKAEVVIKPVIQEEAKEFEAKVPEKTPEAEPAPKASPVKKMTEKMEEEYASIKNDPRFKAMNGEAPEVKEEIPEADESGKDPAPNPPVELYDENDEPVAIAPEEAAAVFGEEPQEIDYESMNEEQLRAALADAKIEFKSALDDYKSDPTPERLQARSEASALCAAINKVIIEKGYGVQ